MSPLTGEGEKCLVEVGGRPLIEWLIRRLPASIDDVCVVVGEPDSEIRRRLGDRCGGRRLRWRIQEEPRGVGDAILRAAGLPDSPFLVVLGDTYFEDGLGEFVGAWRSSGRRAGVLFEEAPSRPSQPVGLVRVEDGLVRGARKSSEPRAAEKRVAGAAVLDPAVFTLEIPEVSTGTGGELELETLVERLLEDGVQFVAVPFRGWRRNANRPEDVERIRQRLAGGPEASPNAPISDSGGG